MAAQRLSIRIPEKLQEELDSLAEATGRSESEIVRDALEDYCMRHAAGPTCYDVAQKAGMIGTARNLPHDLSTGTRHKDGFGRE